MTWCIAFPYCPNEPIREEAFALVSEFYAKHFPDVPQLTHSATAIGRPFLRAKTRNQLVMMAADYDVIALIDADTLIDPDSLRKMVEIASEREMFMGKPFLKGVNMPLERQRQLAAGETPWPRGQFNDPGAAWVIRPSSWWAAGGMDEELTGWGAEDSSFAYLFAALGGTTENDTPAAVKTEHPALRWRADPQWPATIKRELVTKAIWEKRPDLAREWLDVRHNPGVDDEWVARLRVRLPRNLART